MSKTFKSIIFMNRLKKYEQAAIARSWKGTRLPEEHAEIDKRYDKAKAAVLSYVLDYIFDEPEPPKPPTLDWYYGRVRLPKT